VFYKRGIPEVLTSSGQAKKNGVELTLKERMVKTSVVSTFINGGEMRVRNLYISGSDDPFQVLRAGQWVMVCGPHPASTDEEPRFALAWYQVMAIDEEGIGMSPPLDAADERLLTLRGPEWPWQPQPGTDDLSNNLCLSIMPGAVAVHTRTLRLEPTRGAAMGGGAAWGTDPTTPQQEGNPWRIIPHSP
jgi:hypothetical protein